MNAYVTITEQTLNKVGEALKIAKQMLIEVGYHKGEPNSPCRAMNDKIDAAIESYEVHREVLQK